MTSEHDQETLVDQVGQLLLQRIGLRPEHTFRGRLRRAIRDEMAGSGQDVKTYFDSVASGGDCLQGLLNRVTVQESAFFRHPEHFEVLARDVLAALPRPVKIWSAGCANGQEAFSLAMVLDEQGIDGSVVGTDLSTTALQRTAEACYLTREVSGLSPSRVGRHLSRHGDSWHVNASVRDRVSILQHNLLDPVPAEVRSCQVIFCRNVLIYLAPEHARAFLDRIADTFPVATPLFLGASETIWQVSDRFKAVAAGGTFIHRQAVAGAASVRAGGGRRRTNADPVRPPFAFAVRGRPRPAESRPIRPALPALAGRRGGSAPAPESPTPADMLSKAGQDAIAAGDFGSAVVAFRKCVYIAPDDPMAQLHLGLALEASGDHRSAQRAFAATRRALLAVDPVDGTAGVKGYATTELANLLDSKQRAVTP